MSNEPIPLDELPEPDGYIQYRNGCRNPAWMCSMCGEYECQPYCIGGFAICDDCAEKIANHYNYRHGGEWITWDNPPPIRTNRKPSISKGKRTRVHERDAYQCRYCGTRKDLTLDHVVPLIQGGDDSDGNLVTCCKSCNSRKNGRTPQEARMEMIEMAMEMGL
jgi:hypothetical protein